MGAPAVALVDAEAADEAAANGCQGGGPREAAGAGPPYRSERRPEPVGQPPGGCAIRHVPSQHIAASVLRLGCATTYRLASPTCHHLGRKRTINY